ncbi:high-affinity nicotinic acid transporter [Aureobasidium pullulans]|nr:high-affinity nicotinic acid transporter [Aureobasidium pullulans]
MPSERVPMQDSSEKGMAVSPAFDKSTVINTGEDVDIGTSELYVDPKKEAAMMRKFDLVAIGLLGLFYMLANLDRSNIGNAKTAGLDVDIHLKGNQYGNAVTLLYATYVPFEAPAAILLKIIGPTYLLSFCAFAWGLCCMCTAFVEDVGGLYTVRLLTGLFEAGLIPCINVYLSMVYKKSERGKRSSVIFAFSAFASAFGGLLAYGLTQIHSGGYLNGWLILFLFEALLTIVVVPIFFFGFPKTPQTAWFLTEEENHWGIDEKFSWGEVIKVLRDPKWYTFWIFQFSVDVSLYGFTTFLPTILTGLGYKSYHSNLMTVPIYAWGLIWFLLVAWASDRYGMRGPFIAGPLVLLIIGYAILMSVESLGVRYFACYIIVMGIYPTTGMSMMWLSDNVAQHYKRATMIGLSLTFGNTAGVAVGQIFTSADSPRYRTGISISMGLAAVALACVFSLMLGMTVVNKRRAERIRKAEEAGTPLLPHPELGDYDVFFKYSI